MKKIILFLCCVIVAISAISFNLNAETYTIDNLLGKTINCVKAESYGDTASFNAIDESFCHTLNCEFSRFYGNTNYSYKSSLSYSEMKKSIQSEYTLETKCDKIPVKMFTLGGYSSFSTSATKEKENNASSAYTQIIATKTYGTYTLYADEHLKFKDHITDSFKYDLRRAYDSNNSFTFENLFDRYGTHFINNYTYGDKIFIDLSMYSNDVIISGSINASIASSINGKLDKATGSVTVKEAISSAYKNQNYEIENIIKSYTASNNMLIEIGENDDIISKVSQWNKNSNENNGTIISLNSSQLIPIWECIPDEFDSTIMKNEFINYAKENQFDYDTSSSHVFNDIKGTIFVRNEDLKIKDTKDFAYTERLYFGVKYGVSIIKEKYTQLTLNVKMKAWKYSKGNRHLYIYDQEDVDNENKSNYLTRNSENITVTSRKSSAPDDVEVELIIYTTKLNSLNLCLEWRASGSGNDTWHNSQVSVDYTFKAKGD